ncbi:MAG: preprotein translocase subunit SecE [Gammaproteobacteria bacterium]|nr:preprotein translocase subunit SecE [Gammaproteobacteria bacterium]MDD9824906.1 preprotein translocase subunit SecE [Gammaproteobacteria bacterium]
MPVMPAVAMTKTDIAKLAFASLVLVAAIVVYYSVPEEPFLVWIGLMVGCAVIAVLLAFWTTPGQRAWAFLGDVQSEVRKVIWPERKQTVQMTLLVAIMVILVALILGLLDWILGGLIEWFIG